MRRILKMGLIVGVATMAGAQQPQSLPELSTVGTRAMELTNVFRKQQRLVEVTENAKLKATAKEFAEYMARTGEYGHEADGRKPGDRVKAKGYEYALVLENIAWMSDSRGFSTEALSRKFVEGWKNSPPHRKNMLDPDVTETAVAVAKGPDDPEKGAKYYGVQLFARPMSQMVRFKIENLTGRMVSYRLVAEGQDQTYQLPVRGVRSHEQGRAPVVSVEGQEGIKAKPGDLFQVAAGEGGTVVLSRREAK